MASIRSADGAQFVFTAHELTHSKVLQAMRDDLMTDDDTTEIVLSLTNISDHIFAHVAQYMRHPDHFDLSKIPSVHLMHVLEAANYLDIPCLARLVARRAADYVRMDRFDLLTQEPGEIIP